MTQLYEAKPLSRKNIRAIALNVRQMIGLEKEYYFPIVQFLELVLPRLKPEFNFMVCSKEEMGNRHGLTIPEENTIKIREDVYARANNDVGRDRLTVAHELGHLLLHQGISVQLARNAPGEQIITYKNPEWQADAFAGELLMPAYLVKDLNDEIVACECCVSRQAAKYQLKKSK